ncbi:MAG: DUF4126 domain-containing protein [Ardenticatenaceae bacterium]|nr:DUF4126 domain-containing protein [Ardenticatenaceae bacterium]
MAAVSAFFTAFGLASTAGLNAYIPLLVTGLVARYTDLITLPSPFNALENIWVLLTLAVLLLIEMTVDKIPAVDTLNDVVHTIVRPAAGAILFAGQAGHIGIDPTLAIILGLLAAGSVHATKAAVRPAITATTAGLGNPIVSLIEDVFALIGSLLAILLPVVMVVLLVLVAILLVRWWFGRRARRERPFA